MVHREGDRYSSRTPPWQRECQSGDWELRHMRDSSDWMLERATFLQLESSLGLFSIDLYLHHGRMHISLYTAAGASTQQPGRECLVPTLGESSRICVPTIHLNHTLLGETLTEASERSVNCSSLAQSALVPSLLRVLMDYPTLLPPVQDFFIGPEGQSHPLVLQGHLPLAAWPISGDPSTPRDSRRKLWSLSENLGGPQLNQPTLLSGIREIAGASDGVLIPFQHL